MTWEADKRWSDRFLPEIKAILGRELIAEPPIEEDAEHNTDLMVLRLDTVRIGCRIRKFNYLASYGSEFTIRSGRPSGVKTELTKIIEGWGDYFFYGFSDAEEHRLAHWTLADLKVFRVGFMRGLAGDKPLGSGRANGDDSSTFMAFKWDEFQPELVVASSNEKDF